MKKAFWGYIPYDDKTFKELWETADFVLDANILLNLYRYSKNTKEKVLDSLDKISERIWIPNQTGIEYFNNRVSTILEQGKIYDDVLEELSFSKSIDYIKSLRHSTLEDKKPEIIEILQKCENQIKEIINEDKKKSGNIIEDDYILKKIVNIFDGKVGSALTDKDLESYKKDIDIRYSKKIPPGYKDNKKPDDKKYGDAINWLEIIKYSKNNKKNIIYITDDRKEDWIETINGKKFGPRKELLSEFYCSTGGNIIYIYNTYSFLEAFNKYINDGENIDKEVIDEVKDLDYINPDSFHLEHIRPDSFNKIKNLIKDNYIVREDCNRDMENFEKMYNDEKEIYNIILNGLYEAKGNNLGIKLKKIEESKKQKFIDNMTLVKLCEENDIEIENCIKDKVFLSFLKMLTALEPTLSFAKYEDYYNLYKEFIKRDILKL
ncbi:PIN domain-containing protein [Clostridium perfringens]|uniref:PIN domain-containing protein n=1 Tax=Clostridium perfringens TaxID=1502 RepID=UPI0026E22797|nr:PIN domain-containing protein [Clostridium perfringens]MDM0462634.1 PIN domain-containing protein [Clostridium perfringens]MDM0819814.1 PIN domain-containing protein [Clostridium perfringens]MDO6336727.1 PIN domain-containing protein [Clostridium perfringens]